MVSYSCRQARAELIIPTTVGKGLPIFIGRAKGGNGIEDEKTLKKLKSTLMKIATSDAGEVLDWAKKAVREDGEIKMSSKLSASISSVKMKVTKDTLDCEVKFVDKLKAIELCLKLIGATDGESGSDILVNYDYGENGTDE